MEILLEPTSNKLLVGSYALSWKPCQGDSLNLPDHSTDVPNISVTRPRQAKTVVTKTNSSPRRHIDRSPSPKASTFPLKVTAVKAPMVNATQGNPQHALKDKGVIHSGCSRHMTWNMSYLSDFEELNGRYVAFGGNPKGETLHVNFLENKPNVAGSGPTWLFDIDTLTKTMNYQPVTAGNQFNPSAGVQDQFDAETAGEQIVQQYVLFPVWSSGSTNPHNTDRDVAFDEKEPEFEGRKPESEVNVSLSSSAQLKKHDNKTKREAKGKSPVESLIGYRNLSAEFEDFSDNSINEDNVVGTLVPVVRKLSPNSTNTFSAASLSNVVASPTHEKSSCIDTSQLPDDPNMPKLEHITYFDDEDDVGAEVDFNNLETSITEDGIDYEEVFALVARIEAIILFLAYASFMGFMVYQMDVKSAFLYGTIKEEVCVCQPPGFENPDYPDKVYKVVKVLYGLHQAPRAWYETLANYLLKKGFQRGKIDQTLFIKRQKDDILLVQIYVHDIIFGSINKDLCKAFEKLMKDKFQMSSMGELTFFWDGNLANTLRDTEKPLLKDPGGEDVDVHTYRSMIGSLMYLTSSRPDIMFAVYACARFQVTPKASHLHVVKRILRYLKGKPHLGLWYTKDLPFDLVAYSDSDYAVASLDRKSTTRGVNTPRCDEDRLELMELTVFLLPSDGKVRVEVSAVDLQVFAVRLILLLLQDLVDKKKVVVTKASIRDALHLDDAAGVECLHNEEIFTELAKMGYEKPSTKLTFYKAFFSSQWKFLFHTILQCMSAKRTSWNEFSSSMAFAVICLSTDKVFSGEDTPLFEGMLVVQEVGEGDADEVHVEDVNVAGGIIENIDANEDVVLEDAKDVAVEKSADVEDNADIQWRKAESQAKIYKIDLEHAKMVLSMHEEESKPTKLQEVVDVVTTAKIITEVVTTASDTITAASTTITVADVPIHAVTIAAAPTLTAAPSRRRKGVLIRDPEETTTTSIIIHSEAKSKDKGKGILVEEPKPLKKQAQIEQDEKYARELEAELNKNIDWEDVIDHVYKKAKEDNVVKRYQALKWKPQTEAQARKNMMIYLKNKFNFNVAFLLKTKEQIDKEEIRALKRLNESQEDKPLKKQKLAEEVEELKRHL
nr:putative ribonuclease H-like domain-containing protein [Tanacetum cinerariifolium]